MDGDKTLAVGAKTEDKTDLELKTFLLDVVNADEQMTDATVEYFFTKHASFFSSKDTDVMALLPFLETRIMSPDKRLLEGQQILYRAVILETQKWLQAIWEAEDEYTAEWRLFHLQRHLNQAMDIANYQWYEKSLQPPPPNAPINQAFRYLRRSFRRLKKCANKDCKTPYFVADRGKQSYCSIECAAVAQKEYKRRWWQKRGPQWRDSRSKKRGLTKPKARKSRVTNRKKRSGPLK